MTIAAERRPTTQHETRRPKWPALSYLVRYEWAAAARPDNHHLRRAVPGARRALAIAGGVVLPLLIGVITRHPVEGVFAALGALLAGLASFQGVTRTRLSAVGVAGLGTAISTFVGAAVAAWQPWALIPVIAIWGYVAGLAVSLGQRRGAVAALWPVALLIAMGTPLDPAHAAYRAGLVLAGTALQAVVVTLSWAARRGGHERAAMSASYRDLAEYAERVARGTHQPPAPTAFPATARLADPNPLLPRATRSSYAALLENAEQVRAALASLAEHGADDPAARRLAAESAHVLAAVADTLTTRASTIPELPALPAASSDWHWAATALLTHLDAVTSILTSIDAAPVSATAPTPLADPRALPTLRAHLTPSGEIGRHALRLAVAAGIAETFVRIAGLDEGRWVVLTVFLVLKPDYTSTVSRGVHRAIGTAVGALLGALFAMAFHGTPLGLVLVAGIAVAAAYAVFEVDYLAYSVYLTVFVVLLLDILGLSAETTATVRLTDTAIGALIALVAYAAWPTWHGRTAPQIFARLIDAHQAYVAALLHELTTAAPDAHRLRTLQSAARRARTDAEAAAARLAAEPPHPPLTAEAARALVATTTRLARAELSLHTLVTATPRDPARAAALASATEYALSELAEEFSALR
ncbi:MAG TPA: FUSC family protein [Actinospica sp.]|nr:FUSC family protein [Actinospica sp.]